MDTSVERKDTPTDKQLERIKTVVYRVFEQRGATPALQLVATLRRKKLPNLPKLWTPDPTNPTKTIEGATDVLIIGERYIEIHGRRQSVTLIALFPAVAEGTPVEETSFVEFRSYRQLIPEQVSGRTLLVPRGLPSEAHQSIFTNAGQPIQQGLIGLALEAIYLKSQQLAK